jgi:predicted DNA-binding protein (MmcQ/YjbR family)
VPDIDWIRKFCLSFADATENMQWGEGLCFKVGGKIFAVVDLSKGKLAPISFKCAPEKFQELLEIDGIAPAPYVGRYQWVLLERASILASEELENLIRQSYDLVVAKTPGRKKTAHRKAISKRRRAKWNS